MVEARSWWRPWNTCVLGGRCCVALEATSAACVSGGAVFRDRDRLIAPKNLSTTPRHVLKSEISYRYTSKV